MSEKNEGTSATTIVAIPIFPDATVLDFVGPYQVLADLPNTRPVLVAASMEPVLTDEGMKVMPDHAFADCPRVDVLLVPGGPGQVQAMEDERLMTFLRTRGPDARWVTSVCTGALLLAWAGLLDGYHATTHWGALPCLALFPKVKVAEGYPRFVVDGNRVTGGGVSSGIDQALELARLLQGGRAAAIDQLLNQYAPHPPLSAGDPSIAPPDVLAAADAILAPLRATRIAQIKRLLGEGAGPAAPARADF